MQKETKIAIFLGVTIVGALLSGIMYLYVAYNLAANSVYYAKHIPHGDNRHPQLEMVADVNVNIKMYKKDKIKLYNQSELISRFKKSFIF